MKLRFALVIFVAIASVIGAVVYVDKTIQKMQPDPVAQANEVAGGATDGQSLATLEQPVYLYRRTTVDANYGLLGMAPVTDPEEETVIAQMNCDRVDYSGGRGICLFADRGIVTTHWAIAFGPDFKVLHKWQMSGSPTRTRVAPDGKRGAFTVFVSGHSYAAANFSTKTSVVDLDSGDYVVEDLEKLVIHKDDAVVKSKDINFWGVTFTYDPNYFYATLTTAGKTYLVKGDIKAGTATVVHEGIECPSLSPDGSKIAYKKKRQGSLLQPVAWRISVLDLKTMKDWELAETHSVDDQVYWFDDTKILYSLWKEGSANTTTWTVPADGSGEPVPLIENAYSAVIVRPEQVAIAE